MRGQPGGVGFMRVGLGGGAVRSGAGQIVHYRVNYVKLRAWSASDERSRRTGAIGALQLRALLRAELRAEAQHALEQLVALEVRAVAVEVHEAAGREAPLLEVRELDAPHAARDGRLA